jgi:hypothetical protein
MRCSWILDGENAVPTAIAQYNVRIVKGCAISLYLYIVLYLFMHVGSPLCNCYTNVKGSKGFHSVFIEKI